MTRRRNPGPRSFAAFASLLVVTTAAAPAGKPPLRLEGKGSILFSVNAPARFVMSGVATQLGRYNTIGELEFVPGPTAGSLVGSGVVVFVADNGDQLVGVITWKTGKNGLGQMGFSWRDSVQFSDGTVVSNTGRFVKNRPAGADAPVQLIHENPHQGTTNAPPQPSHIGIIAILIG